MLLSALSHPVCSAATKQEYDRSKMASAFPALSKPMRRLLFQLVYMSMEQLTRASVAPDHMTRDPEAAGGGGGESLVSCREY